MDLFVVFLPTLGKHDRCCVEFNVGGGVIQDQRSALCNETFPKCDAMHDLWKVRSTCKSSILYRYLLFDHSIDPRGVT